MADTPAQDQEPAPTDDDELRRRLLGRIAVAAVVIVGLLGSLAMFDALNTPEPPVAAVEPPPVVAAAKPAEEKPAAEPEKTAAEPEKEKAAGEAAAEADKNAATPPAVAAAGASSAPAATVVKSAPEHTASPGAPPLQPLPAEKPLTKPATPRQAMIRPSEPIPPTPPLASRPDPQRELAQAPGQSPWGSQRSSTAPRPLSQAVQTIQRQFALQLGVFNNLANAEDLRAKLELHGIPSMVEARVQVGPFKSREEIEAARDKLKALGMDAGIMISLRK